MQAINPTTEQPLEEYAEHTPAQWSERLDQAQEAYFDWRTTPMAERAELLRGVARLLRADSDRLAALATDEMGKPIVQAEAEIEKCAWVCDFYAERAAGFLAPRPIKTDAAASYVRYDPLGVVLAVMPWNFPFWQVFRFAAPSLAAGNVGLLKHAANVPGCAVAIEDLFCRAGFPRGVFTTLLISSAEVRDVLAHPAVAAVTLTGSDAAGRAVAAQAGGLLKKSVLELGGSDPMIVLADADPAAAAALASQARTHNAGQSCIAAKRFLVEAPIATQFENALVAAIENLKIGDPRDRQTQVGPLAREDILIELHDQVQHSIRMGASCRTGGRRVDCTGYFYLPTVLTGVTPEAPAFAEETFGPVAAVARAADFDELVHLANATPYGLGASVITGDPDRAAAELVPRIEAGCVFINEMVKSDPRLPFGGVKHSGYGRELGEEGIREFTNIKTVWVA